MLELRNRHRGLATCFASFPRSSPAFALSVGSAFPTFGLSTRSAVFLAGAVLFGLRRRSVSKTERWGPSKQKTNLLEAGNLLVTYCD
jgi:hypothetical protein